MMKRERELSSVRVSSKNQIVIPEAVRNIEGILPGDDIALVLNSDDEIIIRNKSRLEVSTIENMDDLQDVKLLIDILYLIYSTEEFEIKE